MTQSSGDPNSRVRAKVMSWLALVVVGAWACSPVLGAELRVHRIDKLGTHSKTSPRFDHTEARAEAKIVFPELAKANGWHFSQSDDSEVFTDATLEEIDVIIFDNNSGGLFSKPEREAFERWVRNGGGVVGIHGATHAHKGVNESNEAEWPFWYALWGVLHKTGPKQGPQGRRGYADWVQIINADKRWTEHVPKRWRFEQVEWYFWNYNSSFSNVQIIAIAEASKNQPELPAYYPVTWCHEIHGGRVWYTNMGHYAANYRQPEFVAHLVDGIEWAGKKK